MDHFGGWCKSKRRLEGWTAIVTGCNTGIGKETVATFYKKGARVIMACRSLEKAKAAKADIELSLKDEPKTGELEVYHLDLCSLQSVREFSSRVMATEQRLDALVCNAGVMMCPEGRTPEGFETHIGSNHFAHSLLALLLLPLMIKSAPARIVFVSSTVHTRHKVDIDDFNFDKKPYNAFEAYCRSKGANLMFATALADKLKEHNITGVTTYSLHPGVVRTEVSRNFDQTLFSGMTFVFNNVFGWFLKSPLGGAQTTIYCAIDEGCANESGLYYSDCAPTKPSKKCRDSAEISRLWDETIKGLKLNLNKYNPFGTQYPTEDAFL